MSDSEPYLRNLQVDVDLTSTGKMGGQVAEVYGRVHQFINDLIKHIWTGYVRDGRLPKWVDITQVDGRGLSARYKEECAIYR